MDDGVRTRDFRSHSPALCQLSYTHHDERVTQELPDMVRSHPKYVGAGHIE